MVRRLLEPFMPSRSVAYRLALAGAVVLLLSACGRRGALEPPPDPAAQNAPAAAQPAEQTLPSPVATPSGTRTRTPFERPKRPFVLDPLL
jgi:hypothetical protein